MKIDSLINFFTMKVHVTFDTPFMLDLNFPANVWDLTLILKILIFRTQSHGNPPNTSSGIFMQDSAPAPPLFADPEDDHEKISSVMA